MMVDASIGQTIARAGREPDERRREVQAWIEVQMRRIDTAAYPGDSPAPKPAAQPDQRLGKGGA